MNDKIRLVVSLTGIGFILVVVIGRFGWNIRTWNGETSAENWDLGIFSIVLTFGTILLIFDCCWGYLKKQKHLITTATKERKGKQEEIIRDNEH